MAGTGITITGIAGGITAGVTAVGGGSPDLSKAKRGVGFGRRPFFFPLMRKRDSRYRAGALH
jgi:hypothetical protein